MKMAKNNSGWPILNQAEYQELSALENNKELFSKLDAAFSIEINKKSRALIVAGLIRCAQNIDSVSYKKEHNKDELGSVNAVAKPLEALLRELERQGKLPEGDPSAEAYRRFSQHMLNEKIEVVVPAYAAEHRAQYSETGQPIVTFCPVDIGGLTNLLSAVSFPAPYVGKWKKDDFRKDIFVALGEAFLASGGSIGASYKPSLGRVDSPYIRFMQAVIDCCPTRLKDFLKPGLADAARQWLRLIGLKGRSDEFRNGGLEWLYFNAKWKRALNDAKNKKIIYRMQETRRLKMITNLPPGSTVIQSISDVYTDVDGTDKRLPFEVREVQRLITVVGPDRPETSTAKRRRKKASKG